MWTFVERRKRKVWIWLAVERVNRRIVNCTLDSRGEVPLQRLWSVLPRRYCRHCWYFTDQWKAYTKVLPRWQHRSCPKGEDQNSIVGAINCSLRQRCGGLVRKVCSFSKMLLMHTARIKIIINNYNLILKQTITPT